MQFRAVFQPQIRSLVSAIVFTHKDSDLADTTLLLCYRACAAFACTCTMLHSDFNPFPHIVQDCNPARANTHNLKVQSIYFCSFVAKVDQAGRATVPKHKRVKTAENWREIDYYIRDFRLPP